MATKRRVSHFLRTVAHDAVRRVLVWQQKWADSMREPGPGESRGALRGGCRWLGLNVFRALRAFVKPSQRTRIRMWAHRLVLADLTAPLSNHAPNAKLRTTDRIGVNLVGYVRAENGLGESVRASLRALESVYIDFSVTDVRFGCAARKEAQIDETIPQGRVYPINLFHLNADQLCVAYNMFGPDFFGGAYNIGYVVWEQNELPEDWVPALDVVDEIWTPSTFCLDVITRKTNKPVVRIPHCIEPLSSGLLDRGALGLPETGSLFLSMADFASTPERKNPLGSLEAYIRALNEGMGETYFVLKVLPQDSRPDVLERIRELADRYPTIILVDRYMSRLEVESLVAACDCLVSLHRAEGFGFPIAEAMSRGKPVIATGWSGNMDFMNIGNSLPVRYKLTTLEQDTGPYRKGAEWAEPDVDHAAQLMRQVVQDQEYAEFIGARAGEEMRRNYSPQRAGKMIADRLNRIMPLHSE